MSKSIDLNPKNVSTGTDDSIRTRHGATFTAPDLDMRPSISAQNKAIMAALRFGFRPAEIFELAPYLFACAAELSLERRRKAIEAVIEKGDGILPTVAELAATSPQLSCYSSSLKAFLAEQASVQANDVLGRMLEPSELAHDKYFEPWNTPFEAFLKHIEARCTTVCINYWEPDTLPLYSCCDQDLIDFMGDAADALLSDEGIPLAEMPPELFSQGCSEDRAAWALSY